MSIVRAGNRRNLTFTGLGITEELLSPNLAGPLEMLISTIHPGADSEFYSHDGDEAGLVVQGTLQLWVERSPLPTRARRQLRVRQHRPASLRQLRQPAGQGAVGHHSPALLSASHTRCGV